MLTIREYKRPDTIEEAWLLNQKKGNRVLGGMLWTRLEGPSIGTAIDLSGLSLEGIEEREDGFVIGAMTTLRELETSASLNQWTSGAVRECLRHIVGVQLRNMATLGGSLFSRFGFSDVTTLFLALDASVELYHGGVMKLADFDQTRRDRDILTKVFVPKKKGLRVVYQSVRRQATDFPILAMAGVRDGDAFRFAVGARPGIALPDTDPEGILAESGTIEERAAAYGDYLKNAVPTGSNLRGSAPYRRHLIGVLADREVRALLGKEEA